VARAALREPELPTATLDGPARELRLLVDHRDDLVAERTRHINRLRWHLHELDPAWDPKARSLTAYRNLDAVAGRLAQMETMVARIAAELVGRIRSLTVTIKALEHEITARVLVLAPALLALSGVAGLTAAKIVAEVADIRRFRSKDAFARHNGTAPLPAWSGNPNRHRLCRTGNRQLNCALHRIAVTQGRGHPEAIEYVRRREATGDTHSEALRALKRRLSDVVYRALMADAELVKACIPMAA
jgi:transposase